MSSFKYERNQTVYVTTSEKAVRKTRSDCADYNDRIVAMLGEPIVIRDRWRGGYSGDKREYFDNELNMWFCESQLRKTDPYKNGGGRNYFAMLEDKGGQF